MESLYKSLYKIQSTLFLLFWKTWVFHWNVEGINFYEIHKLLDDQYNFMFEELDTLSEHIRSYNIKALGPLEILKESSIISDVEITSNTTEILTILLDDQQLFFEGLKELNDEAVRLNRGDTENLAQQMMTDCGKRIWMLRASLK
jgi:starvation-inducible DNA-binding protein